MSNGRYDRTRSGHEKNRAGLFQMLLGVQSTGTFSLFVALRGSFATFPNYARQQQTAILTIHREPWEKSDCYCAAAIYCVIRQEWVDSHLTVDWPGDSNELQDQMGRFFPFQYFLPPLHLSAFPPIEIENVTIYQHCLNLNHYHLLR